MRWVEVWEVVAVTRQVELKHQPGPLGGLGCESQGTEGISQGSRSSSLGGTCPLYLPRNFAH